LFIVSMRKNMIFNNIKKTLKIFIIVSIVLSILSIVGFSRWIRWVLLISYSFFYIYAYIKTKDGKLMIIPFMLFGLCLGVLIAVYITY
jgi:hypothetical protein